MQQHPPPVSCAHQQGDVQYLRYVFRTMYCRLAGSGMGASPGETRHVNYRTIPYSPVQPLKTIIRATPNQLIDRWFPFCVFSGCRQAWRDEQPLERGLPAWEADGNRIDDAETLRRGEGGLGPAACRRPTCLGLCQPSLAADSSGLRFCNVPLASLQNLGHGCIECRIGWPPCVGRVKGPERVGMQRACCAFVCLRATQGGTATVSCILYSVGTE